MKASCKSSVQSITRSTNKTTRWTVASDAVARLVETNVIQDSQMVATGNVKSAPPTRHQVKGAVDYNTFPKVSNKPLTQG